ncbi:Pre-mRNA-splicing factor [Drechslerella dactyloides]|uniref:Pre-mRNA-splicing factor n=1 Tax=Drechslerella dactyloides TaxID=74499 RepID=A0AAD6IZN5_DREDA|nr:Pre-mRNA-splicing factor [Drechslerella dactyloides]
MSSGYPHHGPSSGVPPPPPLAPGWTEHRAPTGHMYYYHAESKTSTYTRPVAPPANVPLSQPPVYPPAQPFQNPNYRGGFNYNRPYNAQQGRRSRHQDKPDKPKTKRAIPNAEPWLFVTTKKGNTFIHNPETKESLWTAPDNLKDAIESMEKLSLEEERERERIRRRQSALERQRQEEEEALADEQEFDEAAEYSEQDEGEGDETNSHGVKRQLSAAAEGDEGDEEYYDEEEDFDEEHDLKRMRLEEGGPVEFTEDDIAWQLGAMAEDYGLGDEDLEGEDMAPDDGALLFKDLLNDLQISPYSTWDNEMPKMVEDGRYTALPTTKMRKQVFSDWCQERIAVLKAAKEKEVKRDPRIAYLEFLELNATPKLYWPEFKRKYKKEPAMKDAKVTDKDREKYYRDYIARTKTSIETRESDLRKHLKAVKDLTRNNSIDNLPPSIACDIRYIAVPRDRRDQIVESHIRSLPEDAGEKDAAKDILERQQKALQDREAAVRREQFYNSKDIARGKEALRETEMQIKRAMNVGREGLLGHLDVPKDTSEHDES